MTDVLPDRRRRVRNVLVALLATVAPLTIPLGAASASPPSWAAGWSTVPAAAGSLASGQVMAHGRPSAGATVVLFGAPASNAGRSTALARATADGRGRWSIGLPSGTDITPFTDARSGVANFYLQSFDATGSGMQFFSVRTGATGSSDRSQTTGIVLNSDKIPNGTATRPANGTLSPMATDGTVSFCADTVLATWDNITTWIGYTADEAWQNTAESYFFEYAGTSSLGIGVSGTSQYGGFSVSGTKSISSSVGAQFPATHNIAYQNYWAYVSYQSIRHTCYINAIKQDSYLFKPAYYDGGFDYTAADRIDMQYCTRVAAGVTMIKNTTSAYLASRGVNASYIIGINLTAQTGYSSTASIHYFFGPYAHPWCGLADLPGRTSRLQTIHADEL